MWSNQLGLSAQAIAGSGNHHPHDPSDLLRCVNYSEGRFTTPELQARMSGRSLEWGRLMPEWDHLVELLRHEIDTQTDGRAPRTYAEMKRVLNDGIACADCDSTGRSTVCTKCKGSGRRSGGRCRAARCFGGGGFCPTCDGCGYTKKES